MTTLPATPLDPCDPLDAADMRVMQGLRGMGEAIAKELDEVVMSTARHDALVVVFDALIEAGRCVASECRQRHVVH